MNSIRHTCSVKAPADFLFEYSQRNSCRMDWDPFVIKVELHDEHDLPSEGCEVTVRTWNQMTMTCRYVQFRRPDCIAIKMLQGPRLLASFGGSWRFDPTIADTTKTSFTYSFTLKADYQWLTPFAKAYFWWDMKRRLKALRIAAERAYRSHKDYGVLPWCHPRTT